MHSLHDNQHKRTSITELLNPIGSSSSPASAVDAPYSPPPSLHGPGGFLPPHVPSPPYGMNGGAGAGSFSLRAASWDQTSPENTPGSVRRQEAEPSSSSCRFGTSTGRPHQPNSHSVYGDYPRPRPVDETSNYGMEAWSPSSHERSPAPVSYSGQMLAPGYSDERTGACAHIFPAQRGLTHSPL